VGEIGGKQQEFRCFGAMHGAQIFKITKYKKLLGSKKACLIKT
jgi:hypothetical protein